MTEFVDATLFGRQVELTAIESALRDSSSAGVVVEGDMGMGKTALASEIHRRRGGGEIWVRGDRVLQRVPYGAFGLYVDLNADSNDLLVRVVNVFRNSSEATPVVFVDDAHELDESSLSTLSQLATEGNIKIVATLRPPVDDSPRPFSDLVADHVLDQVTLGALSMSDFSAMIEHHLGGIVSQGARDVVDFQSGRVPGKVIELLRYTRRKRRLLERQGVWLLDGLDLDYDERARDVTRLHLSRYCEQQRAALELVILGGEVEVGIMLAAGLGEAADTLVAAGELGLVQDGVRSYAAIENHSSKTIRYTVPVGRSREMFDFVDRFDDSPSERARMLRADWSLSCGARISAQDFVDAARIAVRLGEWQRALRILNELSTDGMAAHELLDLGQLYCDVNKVPIGLDVLAQAVEKACCTSVVLEVFAVWMFRDFHRDSPPLGIEDFRNALNRLETRGPCHESKGMDAERARQLIDMLFANRWESLSDGSNELRRWASEADVPDGLRLCIGLNKAVKELELGRSEDALSALAEVEGQTGNVGTAYLLYVMLKTRALLQEDRADEASDLLAEVISYDLAYFAARSGPADLMWTRIHVERGDMAAATRTSFAAVEALDYWNQDQFLLLALAEAEHMAVLTGNLAAADDFDARYLSLPDSNAYIEMRRAAVLRLAARAKSTEDPAYREEMHTLLRDSEDEASHEIAAMIRIELFRHFGEYDAEAMATLGKVGAGRDCRLLGELGPALRDRDEDALAAVAKSMETRMPDLAERCLAIASSGGHKSNGAGSGGPETGTHAAGGSLTGRERQISTLIVAGMTNAEIADELGVAVRTVEGHTYRMYRKLDITSRDQVAEALEKVQPNL